MWCKILWCVHHETHTPRSIAVNHGNYGYLKTPIVRLRRSRSESKKLGDRRRRFFGTIGLNRSVADVASDLGGDQYGITSRALPSCRPGRLGAKGRFLLALHAFSKRTKRIAGDRPGVPTPSAEIRQPRPSRPVASALLSLRTVPTVGSRWSWSVTVFGLVVLQFFGVGAQFRFEERHCLYE
jgi:hypothetical protein